MKNKGTIFATVLTGLVYLCGVRYSPPDIDHAAVLRTLNKATLEKGKQIYTKSCLACHGPMGTASLPQARSFSKDKLRFGNKPYDMWRTISNGAGMMAAQTWLSPAERYYVIQYIRETFMKRNNPGQYFKITEQYLSTLPKSQRTVKEEQAIIRREALQGSLKYGQEWFEHHQGDYGSAIVSQLKDHATAVLTVMLDRNIHLSYNLLRMSVAAAWQGKLNVSDTKYNRYRGEGQPYVEGKELEGLSTWQWTYGNKIKELENTTGVRAPLDSQYLKYYGYYVNGKKVILSYAISGRDVLEFPEVIDQSGKIILSQRLVVGPGKEQTILIGHASGVQKMTGNRTTSFIDKKTRRFVSAGIISDNPGVSCGLEGDSDVVLRIPAGASPTSLQILRTSGGSEKELAAFPGFVQKESAAEKPPAVEDMVKGGAPKWDKEVITKGWLNSNNAHFDPRFSEDEDKSAAEKLVALPADYPYTVDNIGLPFDNPYNAWIRPTSLGFKSNGDLILGTYCGDVWLASGVDSSLTNITWRRIAAGLFEPMGIKVVDDKIFVTCRNGIVRLQDLNGDSETDFYENFHSDHDVSGFFHSFNFGLERDSKGNFYYAKPGEYTDNKDPGNIIKVSADGKKWESVATGFRVDNGITIAPDDRIFVSDNQGNWTPANKINLIQPGSYYGYVPNLTEPGWSPDGKKFSKDQVVNGVIIPSLVKVPDSFHAPAIWIPQEFDNSPGGGVWSDKNWGPLGNQFIHTSYGTGWVYYFLPHEVEGVTQGAMIALPFQLDAGIQRAAVNPADWQIYTTGLTGWDDGVAKKYGVLSRIRYKGGNGHLISDAQVVRGGLKLLFNFELDPEQDKDPSGYEVSEWNYLWSSRYGSAHYSVKEPKRKGEDTLNIKDVSLTDNNKSVVLDIPELHVAQTVRVRFAVKGKDGTFVKNSVYLTINKIPANQ